MSLAVDPEPVPLVTDTDGVVGVAPTRVTLDTVVAAFREGGTAEEIAQQYPTLQLADVYSVIAYYLRHRTTVDAYLADQSRLGEGVRRKNEGRSDPTRIRDRLLARRPG